MHRHIITGGPGAGKTTLLLHLKSLGCQTVPEPARQILAEQRQSGGEGLPGKNICLFLDLMLSRMIADYDRVRNMQGPVFFDRGVPDILGYAAAFGIDHPPAREATHRYSYSRTLFFAPPWEEIYTTDDERTLSYEGSRQFGESLRSIYQQLGFTVIDLPLLPVEDRAQFLLDHLSRSDL